MISQQSMHPDALSIAWYLDSQAFMPADTCKLYLHVSKSPTVYLPLHVRVCLPVNMHLSRPTQLACTPAPYVPSEVQGGH